MVELFRKIGIFAKKRRLRKILALLLRKALSEKNAAQVFLHLFVETKNHELQKNAFKKLRKLIFRLSFNDIYPVLAPGKIKEHYKKDFWNLVLKLGVDWSDLLCITMHSDFFFAKEAFGELLKKHGKRRISRDRMKRFLIEIMTRRPEFVPEGWLVLKKLNLSYEDMLCIKNSKNYQSDIYNCIRDEIEKIFSQLAKNNEQTTTRIKHIDRVVTNLEELK